MPWVDSDTNDQRLRQMPNPHGFIWDEVHGVGGPPMLLLPPIVNPLGFRPVILRRIFSYLCGTAHANSCPVVGACSHCVTALTLAPVYPGHPDELCLTHRGVRLVNRKNPQQMEVATVSEVS